MLRKPKYGWCDITIGDFNDRASYLTPVHIDILKALCNLCQTHRPQTVFVDAEGWEYYIVFDCYSTFVILCKYEKPQVSEHIIHYKELAKEVIRDIEDDFSEWLQWECFIPFDDVVEEQNRKELTLCLENLKHEL